MPWSSPGGDHVEAYHIFSVFDPVISYHVRKTQKWRLKHRVYRFRTRPAHFHLVPKPTSHPDQPKLHTSIYIQIPTLIIKKYREQRKKKALRKTPPAAKTKISVQPKIPDLTLLIVYTANTPRLLPRQPYMPSYHHSPPRPPLPYLPSSLPLPPLARPHILHQY